MRDALTCYVPVQLAAVAVWPAVARALAPLDDRGWAAAKATGILGVAWLTWFVCMLAPVPFTRTTLALSVVIPGAGAWLWVWRTAGLDLLMTWMRQRRTLLGVWEVLFALAFVFFALVRAHEPSIAQWNGFEKPMDLPSSTAS